MVSGLEPLAAKAAAPAVTKVVGWGGKNLLRKVRDKRVIRRIEGSDQDHVPSSVEPLGELLTPEQASQLLTLMGSAEIEHVAMQIAISHYLGKCGEKKFPENLLRQQLRDLVRLSVKGEGTILDVVEQAVYAELERCVLASSTDLFGDLNSLPEHTRAALIKAAASYATASARNSEILGSLAEMTAIAQFEDTYRSQVVSLHSSMKLPHSNTSRNVPYDRLFVQPRITVSQEPRTLELSSLTELLASGLRNVLLGDPGGGKSTASLKFVYDIAKGNTKNLRIRVPFLIVLKDYAQEFTKSKLSLVEYLEMICANPYAVQPPLGAVEYLLLNGAACVIFDGLDELLDTSLRRDIVQAVEGFTYRYPTTSILVTSRRVGYEEAPLDADLFAKASLEDFASPQVENYARKWFSLDDSIQQDQRVKLAESFLGDSAYVEDLRVNPLMLSLMCGLYSGERYIPKNRPDVYEKCAILLFERWDKQRGIVAPLPFDAHVLSSLRSLALWFYPQQEKRSGLSRSELIAFMSTYLHEKRFDDADEAENAATSFIDFCRGRAWVLTDVGAEQYWFTHQTFLEFFAASQLVRQNPSPELLLTQLIKHIVAAEWDVVAQLALQTLGKTVEDGADDFLALLVKRAAVLDDLNARVNAMSFAARALAFIVPRPNVLRSIVLECANLALIRLPSSNTRQRSPDFNWKPVVELLDGTSENGALTRKYLGEWISTFAQLPQPKEEVLALALYWSGFRRRFAQRMIGASPSVEDYRDTVELSGLVADAAASAAQTLPWVAAHQVEEGELLRERLFLGLE